MKTINYYLSLFFIVLFCLIDGFLLLMLVVGLRENVGAAIMVALFFSAFVFVTVKCYKWHKKYIPDCKRKKVLAKETDQEYSDVEDGDEPLYMLSSAKKSGFEPDCEIIYKDAEGNLSKRKIAVVSFDGRMIESYCFLRNERRTFYVQRIIECVDLSTGEVIKDDLAVYFARTFGIKS